MFTVFFFKQKTAYEMRISDWSSDVCSSDLMVLTRMKRRHRRADAVRLIERLKAARPDIAIGADLIAGFPTEDDAMFANRSEEHTSELQSLMRVSYAVFCLKKKTNTATM